MLVNMPWIKDGKLGIRAGSRWPHIRDDVESNYLPFPFFLAYSTSLLEAHGFTVKLVDAICSQMSNEEFINAVNEFSPDLLVAETSTLSLEDDMAFLGQFGENYKIVLCGPDINIQHPQFLKDHSFVDFVIKGEYEFTLLDLAEHLETKSRLSEVLGINYRENDTIFINPPRPLGDINSMPWPRRRGLQMERYIDSPGAMPFPTVQMLASRGCPYECMFCLWPQVMYGGRNFRVRDPKDVLNEMEAMVRDFHFKSVYFDDDTFGLDKKWTHEFADQLIERNRQGRINVPWAMMTRPDAVDEEILRKLKRSGLWAVKYGIESGNQMLVNNIRKNLDLNNAKRIVKLTHALGIKTHLTFTFGLPGESKETVNQTIKTALELDPFTVQFSITTPFPGTKYFDIVSRNGNLLSKDWNDYDGNTKSVIHTDSLTAEDLVRARRKACRLWSRHFALRRVRIRIKKYLPVKKGVHRMKKKNIFYLAYLFFITVIYYSYLAYVRTLRNAKI